VKGIGSLGGLMKQAKKLQEDLERTQAEIANLRITSTAGGGMVTATVTGKGDLVGLTLAREVVDPTDLEMLCDLVVAAVQDAQRKAQQAAQDKLGPLAHGFGGLPGLPGA
jgi:DNA-binding YbaB/EbfC family protein